MNLLYETIEILQQHGKNPADVEWVGDNEKYCDWDTFAKYANRMYNNDYGCEEVNTDLIVCGSYFWLERHEYDGSEWWEYKELPVKPLDEGEVDIWENCYWM